MDHEQQLLQLQDFEQQVNANVENVQSFFTKSFLETLFELIQDGLDQNYQGDDHAKSQLKTMKSSIRAFSTILPGLFKTVCQNEAESKMWEITMSLIDIVETKLISFQNTGVVIQSIKCLQVLVLLFSTKKNDISLNLIRPNHRVLNTEELEKKCQSIFELLVSLLKSDVESIVTATISCMVVISKKRPQFGKSVSNTLLRWYKNKPKEASTVLLRNVTKAIRLAFVTLIRTESLASLKPDLIQKFGAVGGNVAIFQSRDRRSKRPHPQQQQQGEASDEKRIKHNNEYTPVLPPSNGQNVLTNYDITQLPLNVVVDLCMSVLQLTSLDVITQRIPMLPTDGVTLAVQRQEFVRSSTPPYPPPPDQPKRINDPRFRREDDPPIVTEKKTIEEDSKMTDGKPVEQSQENIQEKQQHQQLDDEKQVEVDETKEEKQPIKRNKNTLEFDEEEEEDEAYGVMPPPQFKEEEEEEKKEPMEEDVKPQGITLPSVEERVTQSLNMKPFYEFSSVSTALELSVEEKKELLKMAIQRVFATESELQTNNNDMAKKQQHHHRTGIWLSTVAKLFSRCTPREQTEWKEELLVDYIVESLPTRNDLALEWLYEEYLHDKRELRNDPTYQPSYFSWFHKLLEKSIPTLDAKDRSLTKLLLDAPELDARTVDLVKQNLEQVPERFVSCVSTLRSLVANRPTVRFQALQILLDLCVNPNDKIRRTSIVAVKKWNPNQEDINNKVEEFSTEALFVLAKEKEVPEADVEMAEAEKDVVEGDDDGDGDVTMENNHNNKNDGKKEEEKEDKTDDDQDKENKGNEGKTEEQEEKDQDKKDQEEEDDPRSWNENDVVRHAELFFVLCTKKPSLLNELFSVYIQTTETARKYIRLHMINMIKSIGMKSPELVSLLRNFPPGGETLVIRILAILCESKPPTREIVAAVQYLSKERSLDVKDVQPILAGRSLASSTKK